MSIPEASRILSEWDRRYNPESLSGDDSSQNNGSVTSSSSSASSLKPEEDDDALLWRSQLIHAVFTLNDQARQEREYDATKGRCMLGICAASTDQGIATLQTWVTQLQLPRGLLHGMDTDGVPIQLEGGVYIKYNSGGVYTFADIRKSNMGFDALWKPGMCVRTRTENPIRFKHADTIKKKQTYFSIFHHFLHICRA
jgi:hypothetical protein